MKKTNSPTFKLGTNSQSKRKKWVILVLSAIILLLIVAGAYYGVTKSRPSGINKQTESTIENDNKAANDAQTKEGTPEKDSAASNEVKDIPASQDMKFSAFVFRQESGAVTVTAPVNGARTAGTCVFTFTSKDSRPVVRQVSSAPKDTSQECMISIPEVEFDKIGGWQIEALFYTPENKTSSSQNVIIK